MSFERFFEQVPILWLFIGSLLIILVAIEAGYGMGKRRIRKSGREKEAPVGSLVAAMLGLLAFIMAFTFSMSASIFEARRNLIVSEANAIGTAYLRTEFLPEPVRSQSKSLLREYVQGYLQGVGTGQIRQMLESGEALQKGLWAQAAGLSEQSTGKVFWGLYVQSLNEMFDIRTQRMNEGLHKRIPAVIWVTLYLLAIFSMLSVGYLFGLDKSRALSATLFLALAFSLVLVLIADLSRPDQGLIRTSQWSMVELEKKLK